MTAKWDKKRANWYAEAVEHSDYPQKAVSVLSPLLKKCNSVIDIGAGCGALSIPIARKVKTVTAIEPSGHMYALLRKRAKTAGIKNIHTYNTGWKETRLQGGLHTKLKPHDMVICAKIPGSVVCNIKFVRYLEKISTKFVVYIQDTGEWNKFYYKDLYPKLFRKKYPYESDYLKTYAFLHRHGIFANIKMFDYYFDQPFEDFDEAMDFWQHRLKVTLSPEKKKVLADFLRKKLVFSKRGNLLTAPFGRRKTALIWWTP